MPRKKRTYSGEPFLISSKRTSILDSYIESYDSSLESLYFEFFISWNSSTPVEDKRFAFTFSCMQDVNKHSAVEKKKMSSINLNLISKLYLVLSSIFSYFVHILWRFWHILWRISKRPNHRSAVSGRMNCFAQISRHTENSTSSPLALFE